MRTIIFIIFITLSVSAFAQKTITKEAVSKAKPLSIKGAGSKSIQDIAGPNIQVNAPRNGEVFTIPMQGNKGLKPVRTIEIKGNVSDDSGIKYVKIKGQTAFIPLLKLVMARHIT